MSASLFAGKIPAFAQSTSMPPSRSSAVAAICSQSFRRLTSACTEVTSPASAAAASLATAASRPVISTCAPLRANTLAIPLPIPRVPPVTTTDRPETDVNMALLSQTDIRLASLVVREVHQELQCRQDGQPDILRVPR